MKTRYFFGIIAVIVALIGSGCSMDYRSGQDGGGGSSTADEAKRLSAIQYLKSSDIDVKTEIITNRDDENAALLSEGERDYMHYKFTKQGNTSSDEADYSGTNAAVLAKNSAVLTLRGSLVYSSGDHAHGVFSFGDGTSVTVSDCVVSVRGANSAGLMTSSGGTVSARHVTCETFGASSPAVHIPEGGGAFAAERGRFCAAGANSPVILAEDSSITVSRAKMEAGSYYAAVIDGRSSVVLASCDVTAGSGSYAVMMYQSDSGIPSSNKGEFTMAGGKITAGNSGVFYVTNAEAAITLTDAEISNDSGGVFLSAEASSFGVAGANGGQVSLTAADQVIEGNIILDGISDMNMYLTEDTLFSGAVNPSGTEARVFVGITDSRWVLTEDSYIDSLTCEANSIILNGHTLYVDGTAYTEGTESTGTEIVFSSSRIKQTDSQDVSSEDPEDPADPSDTETPATDITESEDTSISFDARYYSTGTVNGVSYRAYTDIVYVSKPASAEYQRMNIYIPEPYFSSRTVNGYTAQTAPIFMPNNSSGYLAAPAMTLSATNPIGLAVSRGLVVASPALRGRNITGGTAPAAIVDYKAAVRYLRANKGRIPAGDTDKIISCGVSSGGALSALLGASGNMSDYDTWLEEIGAAENEDKIFASAVYCPVTNLENADGAYEWLFGGKVYGADSVALSEEFEAYVNSLGLTKSGEDLGIYEDDEEYEEGFTFRRYIEGIFTAAAQEEIYGGGTVSADWVKVSGDSVISADLKKYAESFTMRQKTVPAFDKFDLSSPENNEFGYKHFTDYSLQHTTAGGTKADYSLIAAMNPMECIDSSDPATFWRIRHGVNDRDIPVTIPAILAVKLENSGCMVNFAAEWGQGHNGYYDSEELFDWIDFICK